MGCLCEGRQSYQAKIKHHLSWIYTILVEKYGFDAFNQAVIARGTRGLRMVMLARGDEIVIDGIAVNGTAKSVRYLSVYCVYSTGHILRFLKIRAIFITVTLFAMILA